jgi:hypothetical protein
MIDHLMWFVAGFAFAMFGYIFNKIVRRNRDDE